MKIFSFDAETDGLWGKPFAIAAILYEERQHSIQGWPGGHHPVSNNRADYYELVEVARFEARCDADIQNEWVLTNVFPAIEGMKITHKHYEHMLSDFADFYIAHKTGADCVVHMGYIVEAKVLRDMREFGFIGDFHAPYPLYDVSGNLQQAGENPTSVDAYAKKHGLDITDYGTTHHPLYDCEVTAKVYYHLQKSKP